MNDYFFPSLFLIPEFDPPSVETEVFSLVKRRWETSILDLATLATNHKLNLPYQVMDAFLSKCNGELCVRRQPRFEDDVARLQSLKISLYGAGVSPFITPFGTTYSINDYSGINSRDSEPLRPGLPAGMQDGLKTKLGTVEAWWF